MLQCSSSHDRCDKAQDCDDYTTIAHQHPPPLRQATVWAFCYSEGVCEGFEALQAHRMWASTSDIWRHSGNSVTAGSRHGALRILSVTSPEETSSAIGICRWTWIMVEALGVNAAVVPIDPVGAFCASSSSLVFSLQFSVIPKNRMLVVCRLLPMIPIRWECSTKCCRARDSLSDVMYKYDTVVLTEILWDYTVQAVFQFNQWHQGFRSRSMWYVWGSCIR